MIEFLYEDQKTKQLTVADVEEHQFFVNSSGCLCQKRMSIGKLCRYNILTGPDGKPLADAIADGVPPTNVIRKIIPRVEKIKF